MAAFRNSKFALVLCFSYGRGLIPTEHFQALETSLSPSISLSLIPSGQSATKSKICQGHDAAIRANQIDQFRAQREEWKELQNSIECLEKEVKSCQSEGTMSNELENAQVFLDELKFFRQHIFTFFGEPKKKYIHGKPRSIESISNEEAKNLRKRVMNLLLLVSTTRRESWEYDHIVTYQNRCILQTIDYLKTYNLMPANVVKDVDSVMKSPKFFRWFVEVYQACTSKNKFSYKDKDIYTTPEIFDHNFLVPHLGKFYQGLSNDEKDLFWIYFLKHTLVSPHIQTSEAFLETITYKQSDLLIRWIMTLFDDTESFLMNQIKERRNDGDKERFIIKIKPRIAYLFGLIIQPLKGAHIFGELECDATELLDSLIFFCKMLGEDLMNTLKHEVSIGEEIELKIHLNFAESAKRYFAGFYALANCKEFVFRASKGTNFHTPKRVWTINRQLYYQKALKALSDWEKLILQVQNNPRLLKNLLALRFKQKMLCSINPLENSRKILEFQYRLFSA